MRGASRVGVDRFRIDRAAEVHSNHPHPAGFAGHPPHKGEGLDSRSRSRERIPLRGIGRSRPRKSEGARDAGDFQSPQSCVEKVERHRRSCRKGRSSSGIPRAVFEACSTRSPEDLPIYPPLAEPLTGISVVGTTQAPDPEVPVTSGDARRNRAAWAPAIARAFARDGGHRHPPTSKERSRDAPRMGWDVWNIVL